MSGSEVYLKVLQACIIVLQNVTVWQTVAHRRRDQVAWHAAAGYTVVAIYNHGLKVKAMPTGHALEDGTHTINSMVPNPLSVG